MVPRWEMAAYFWKRRGAARADGLGGLAVALLQFGDVVELVDGSADMRCKLKS